MCGDLEEYMVNSTAEHIKTKVECGGNCGGCSGSSIPGESFQPQSHEFWDPSYPRPTLGHERYMWEVFKMVLMGEVGEKYDAYMREKYGEGDFTLTWEVFVITAEKS
ncbi:hypothetical protein K438DRAFT_1788458 [Mycena galopus ATCC 62051]|nr:hypothetical protein K438DRAFT_1788458 [Mycena galopus ATCC 62051]